MQVSHDNTWTNDAFQWVTYVIHPDESIELCINKRRNFVRISPFNPASGTRQQVGNSTYLGRHLLSGNPAQFIIDDLAVWNRALRRAEIDALVDNDNLGTYNFFTDWCLQNTRVIYLSFFYESQIW